MFYPSGYRCKAVRVAGGIMRCNTPAGPSGLCPEHEVARELPPTPPLILFKVSIKEGGWVWRELVSAGVEVAEWDRFYAADVNDRRAEEERFRKNGEMGQDRIQRQGEPRQAGTGVPVFGVGGHKGPFCLSGIIPELQESGYVVVGCHILKKPKKKPALVVALFWGGKPEDGFCWEQVLPIAQKLWQGFSFGANVWVNPPPIDHPEMAGSHALDFNFGKSDARPKYKLRWDGGSWGLEPIAVPAPETATSDTKPASA